MVFQMSFRTIGELAGNVMAGLEMQQRSDLLGGQAGVGARANSENVGGCHAPASGNSDRPSTREEERPDLPPMREASPSQFNERATRLGFGDRTGSKVRRFGLGRLKLVSSRDMGTVHRRHGFPRPAVPRPMLLVVAGGTSAPGDVRDGVHDASAAS
jgi:hypothetical protein